MLFKEEVKTQYQIVLARKLNSRVEEDSTIEHNWRTRVLEAAPDVVGVHPKIKKN